MGEGECEPIEASKKGRRRKKQLYNLILQQMEFYFSDSNLSKDRFLSQLLCQDPYIDLQVFFSFNKIKKLSCTPDDIRKAIRKSDVIELSQDNEKIRRKLPIKVKENVDECTIYVENIKADATHEWLIQVFSDFGNVVYVSIPKYAHNRDNKGFAFVEFSNEKDAENTLQYFESIGCKMPSETDPEELKSIKTFEGNAKSENMANKGYSMDVEKIDECESKSDRIPEKVIANLENQEANKEEESTECEKPKKRKLSVEDPVKKKRKIEHSTSVDDSEGNTNETVEVEDAETKKKKKYKKDKKEKKKNYIKEHGLQVLSKREWKKMRNRYLDLQRKKMKTFKKYLVTQKCNQRNHDKLKKAKDEVIHPVEDNPMEENTTKLEFIPGVIVRLKLPESCTDVKKLKNELKSSPNVKYVDIPLPCGSDEVLIRFASNESAKQFCTQEFPGVKTILENEDEKSYWRKIQNDRLVKFTKETKKQRGRDKLLKKAEKERARHLRFDEGDKF